MAAHRWVGALCAGVALAALALALLVTAWTLVVVPFAVVIGVASWNGIGVGKTLDAMGDSANDPGSGPAGIIP